MGNLWISTALSLLLGISPYEHCFQAVTTLATQACRTPVTLVELPREMQELRLFPIRYKAPTIATKNENVCNRVQASVDTLSQKLDQGEVIYGVNTGFGGSADTHTNNHISLQKALLQTLNSAILLPQDRGMVKSNPGKRADFSEIRSHSVPTSWVRAAMIIRCNSLLRGHSGVRFVLIDHILQLLKNDMIPVIPLRGSISASGDLTPLSYIAGVLEGNPDISVLNEKTDEVIAADEALEKIGLSPIELGPKEGLGLLNGTAFSAGTSALVLHDVSQLLLLSHVLTAMGTEALGAGRENYHPFISKVRPHDGQRETASTLFKFLRNSNLAMSRLSEQDDQIQDGHTHKLAQTRYALRTSPQWIGPQIENLSLALQQIQCELNSTTDNPLIDSNNNEIHHGGNFQAVSITTAMEKAQNSMQMLGKMIFAQCSEIINPDTNNGLPPNLSIDDPSLSFTCKGLDINMASYMSELAYLNHPVSNHVQSAEMHNQSLNSLAFISCRYASDAVEILSMMSATYLYVLCQALDLCAFHIEFVRDARPLIHHITREVVSTIEVSPDCSDEKLFKTQEDLWNELMHHWGSHRTCDLHQRCLLSAKYSVGSLLEHCPLEATLIEQWKKAVSDALEQSYQKTRELFIREPSTKKYLCHASRTFYTYVREHLRVLLNEGIVDHPTYETRQQGQNARSKQTIGSQVSKIYEALRHGEFRGCLESCWEPSENKLERSE